MPKANCTLNNLERFHLSNYLDTSLYFWVRGIRSIMPTITIEQCIMLYCKDNKIDDFDATNLRNRFTEMQKRHLEYQKTPANYLKNGTSK
jgi:phage regulator Rha-like protein